MTSTSRRLKTVRTSTKELLAAGEQPHIEFKSKVVINSVAKQAAAGANYIAHQPAAKVYTIIFGVAEKDSKVAGVKIGSIVGLLDDTGAALDLDGLQLQIGQAIHDRIIPPPTVVMYQENVATTPILVVEVRPTTAPHVVDERWLIRGVGGIQPMKQDQALQIFKNQRLSAWIEEFEGSDPLKRALRAIQGSIEDFRWAQMTEGYGSAESPDFAPIEAGIRNVGDIVQSLDHRIGDVLDGIDGLQTQTEDISRSFGEIPAEDAWWAIMRARQMRMITLHSFVSKIGIERTKLIDELFDDYLGDTAEVSSYPENIAEAAAYRTLRRAGSETSLEVSAASDLVSASLWRINGMPPVFGIGWVDEARDSTDLLSDERMRSKRVRDVEPEIGLLYLPGIAKELVHSRLGSRMEANQRILSTPTKSGVYRVGVPMTGAVWPIVFAPGVHVDTSAAGSIGMTTDSIRALVAESGGSSWCIEGPGVAIPTS
jgi:hypothetical protein